MYRTMLAVWLTLWAGGAVSASLPDPTRPPAGLGAEVSDKPSESEVMPKVTGIRIGARSRVAILDGGASVVGDLVGGYEVVAIETGLVKLRRNGLDVDLPLLPNIKKEKHKGR